MGRGRGAKIQRKRERDLKKKNCLPISIHSPLERGGRRGVAMEGRKIHKHNNGLQRTYLL